MKKILPCGHSHVMQCHIDPKTYLCPTKVNVKLDCDHEASKACYIDIEKFPCPHPCEVRITRCGHTCDQLCHIKNDPDHLKMKCFKECGRYRENCSTQRHKCPLKCYQECLKCEIVIKKKRTVCKHVHDIKCCEDVDSIVCEKRCDKKMNCGHTCRMKCCDPCGNCKVKVDKILKTCGHKVTAKCSEEPNSKLCIGKCPLLLSCGHKCQKRCNQQCTTKCYELVYNPFDSLCGHQFKIPCYKRQLLTTSSISKNDYYILQHCEEPCDALLDCEHKCKGTCGICAQGRIHQSCQEQCGATLICGHACEIPCRETCQPCNKKCEYRCVHSKCGTNCGEPCTPCREPCRRYCEHIRCTNNCGEICTVPPCKKPCLKPLKCGHQCLGFCGDICPPICRVCDPENEAFQVFFGDEDEPDSKFVFLEECKHCIESNAMENWLNQSNVEKGSEINIKQCPRCKTPIIKSQRYSDYIKIANKDVTQVKRKLFGSYKENTLMRQRLNNKIISIITKNTILLNNSKNLKIILETIENSLKLTNKGKRQLTNKITMSTYEAQLQIIERIVNIFKKCNLKNQDNINKCIKHVDFLIRMLLRQNDRITKQEIQDFQCEILRFEKFGHICIIEEDANFKHAFTQNSVKKIHSEIWGKINSIHKFTNEDNDYLKINIKALIELVNKNMQVTAEEKAMIVKAMGMSLGHWYKCPNGHTYCITECGGAMQIGKCNECGAQIGGTQHTLLRTNRHDGSMDGSKHAAWSDAANMENYRFDFDD